MHFLTLFTKKNVGKSDALDGEEGEHKKKNNKSQVPKPPSALSRHLKVKEAVFIAMGRLEAEVRALSSANGMHATDEAP